MRIIEVNTKKDLKRFIKVPRMLFKDHPCFTPGLDIDENGGCDRKNNPILANSDYKLFLVEDDSCNALGRCIAYIDHSFNEFYKSNIGFFGSFECIDNKDAADLLINACEHWLRANNVDSIRGPINPVAENWGFVYEGYERRSVYLAPWNPEYYHKFFMDNEYSKVKDLYVYEADIKKGYKLPDRYMKFSENFYKRYPYMTLRRLDLKNIKKDAYSIWEISNISLSENWGYVPVVYLLWRIY